jgi:hypothetical protein
VQSGSALERAIADLGRQREEWSALNLAGVITDADFTGDNDHLKAVDLQRLFALTNQVKALLTATSLAEFDAAVATVRGMVQQLYGTSPPTPLAALLYRLER